MKNSASLAYNVLLVLGDVLGLVASFVAAFAIRAASSADVANPMQASTFVVIFVSALPFWILIFALLGLYNSTIHERRFAEAARLFVGSFIGLLFMVFWDYMSLQTIFPAKLVPIYGFLIAFVVLVGIRNVARIVRTSLFSFGVGLSNVVLVGNTPITRELLESLTSPKSGYRVLGVVGYRKQLPATVHHFANFVDFLAADPQDLHGIIQTELYPNEERNSQILNYAQEHHIAYRFVPGNSELFVGNIDVALFRNAIPVIQVRHTALFGWGRIVKRLFDLTVGGLVLLATSPLFVLVYGLEKLTGNSKAVFSQMRLTRYGTPFRLYKFRTQHRRYDGTTPEEAFAMMGKPELAKEYRANGDMLPNDPRVTKIGKFLRATSLDELPQLLNVVKGDLSLVGPRPLIPQELGEYGKKHIILSVKSGLTGLAVVSGRRNIPFEERRKLDLYYVQNWSFGLDMMILLKTIRIVLDRRGAK